jgi:hypothetical protein
MFISLFLRHWYQYSSSKLCLPLATLHVERSQMGAFSKPFPLEATGFQLETKDL